MHMLRKRNSQLALLAGLTAGLLGGTSGRVEAQTGKFDLLVSSSNTNSVKRYDGGTGGYVDDFIAPASGSLSNTQEVLLGPDGQLYVVGFGNQAVFRYDRRTGAFLSTFTKGYRLNQPTKMTFSDDGMLYVSQWGSGQTAVARFDATTGDFVDEATPNLNQPMQVAFDDADQFYVANFGSADVRRFQRDGTFVDVFTSGGNLQGPVNLWFKDDGDLLVIDWTAGVVKRFDGTTGDYKSDFVTGLTNAEGWTYGPDGMLYVADWAQHVVRRYDPDTGAPDRIFASGGGLQTPNGLLFVERFPDFTVSLSTNDLTLTPAESADITVTLQPDRDIAYPDPVSLVCSGPTGVQCTFSPDVVVPGSSGATATLTVSPTAGASVAAGLARQGDEVFAVALILVMAVTASVQRHRSLRPARVLAAAALVILLSCGTSTEPGPNDQTITVNVTGTSADLAHSASLRLTIKR